MAFPTLINGAGTANATPATSQPLTMPGSIVAGRLLVAYVFSGTGASMAGWTQIFSATNSLALKGFAKVAAGSDTGTVTYTTGTSIAAVVEQYDNWSGSISDIVAAAASGADPPNCNPAVSRDWLWVAVLGGLLGSGGTVTAVPSGYADLAGAQTTGGVSVTTGDRALTASSEDPGTFTNTGTLNFPISATIAIAPFVATSAPQPWVINQSAVNRAYNY